jgi:hypothetical protein
MPVEEHYTTSFGEVNPTHKSNPPSVQPPATKAIQDCQDPAQGYQQPPHLGKWIYKGRLSSLFLLKAPSDKGTLKPDK